MATKQVILYPISDVNLSHTCSNGNVGYSLINDPASTPDDGSSYIYASVGRGSSENTTSTFKVSESSIDKKFVLSALTTTVRAMVSNTNLSGSVRTTLSINGGTTARSTRSSRMTTSYANSTYTFTSVVGYDMEYNNFAEANIVLGVNSNSVNNADKDYTFQIRITQAYVTATYIPIHTCNAVNAEGCTSVSVSSSEVRDENTCTFNATFPDNYTFIGWYSDFECTNLVSENASYTATITGDTQLYARAAITYEMVAYGDEYCTVEIYPHHEEIGKTVTATCTLNDDMKEFVGWYSNPERTNLVSSANPYSFNVTGATTLYAKCRPKYQMYLKINGAWVECSEVYKKVDGVWVLQTELEGLFDTTKNYIKNDV